MRTRNMTSFAGWLLYLWFDRSWWFIWNYSVTDKGDEDIGRYDWLVTQYGFLYIFFIRVPSTKSRSGFGVSSFDKMNNTEPEEGL